MPPETTPEDYYLEFQGRVDWNSRLEIEKRCREAADHHAARIYLCMHSGGGVTQDGIRLAHFLQELGTPVSTYNMGTVESAAATIYLGGEHRIMHPGSRFMIHPSTFTLNGRFNESELRAKVETLKNDRRQLTELFKGRTKLPEKLLKAAFGRRDITFDASRALRYELAHEVKPLIVPKEANFDRFIHSGE